MTITADVIGKLREKTGAGIMACKKALLGSKGDFEKAIVILREQGAATASRKSGRQSREGLIYAYIHTGGKLGVLLELNCETDFVALTDEFKNLAREISMQIAATQPQWISREDVPEDVINRERQIYTKQCTAEKKPDNVIPRIVEGKLNKFYESVCLLEQPHIRDSSGKTKMKQILEDGIGKIGENIVVKRYIRYQLGGE